MKKLKLIKNLTLTIAIFIILFITSCDQAILNQDPLLELLFDQDTVLPGSVNILKAVVSDPDTDHVEVTWTVTSGTLNRTSGTEVKWTAPDLYTDVFITVTAIDENDAEVSVEKIVYVRNIKPFISGFSSNSNIVLIGNSVTLTCDARDKEGTELTYNFYSQNSAGRFSEEDGLENTKTWYAPDNQDEAGTYNLIVKVQDTNGESDSDTLSVLVYSDYSSVWVVDSEKKTLEKYGKNGDKILTAEQEFIMPVAVTNNTQEFYGCWVADYETQNIYKISARGKTISTIEDIGRITHLKLHQETNKLVVLNADSNSVYIISTFTNKIIKRIYGFKEPRSLTVNQMNGDVWVCEPDIDRVVRFNIKNPPDTIEQSNPQCEMITENLNNPVNVEIGYRTPTIIYIVDKNDNQIERIDLTTGNRLTPVTGFFLPDKIASSSQQEIWVIDQNGIYYFPEDDFNNVMPASIIAETSFYDPHVIDIDDDGNVWVGDNGSKKLIRINPVGQEISISGFQFIDDIIVNK
jgi:YVTN family beta-propeller protein